MSRYNFLNKLLEFSPGPRPFTSIYLDTTANETGKKTFEVFLKKQISEQRDRFREGTEDRQNFDADVQRIEEFLSSLDPATQGVAIFACRPAGLFKTFEFQVPFRENQFDVLDRPLLFPLIKLISQNHRYAVAQADTNSAHIYVMSRGEVIKRDDIQNEKTNRTEVGGWSQMRYQRHVEKFHQQHANEVIEELEKLVGNDRIEMVVLAGDESVIIPLLKDEMSKELAAKVAGTMTVSVNAAEHEVLEEAEKVIFRHTSLSDIERIEQLKEQDYDGGLGVTSLEKVMAALLNGQVQELYLVSDPDTIEYNIGQVNKLFKDYSPGVDEELPDAKRSALVIEEALRLAAQTADDIRFIDDASLLKEGGGVGALLRYQAKGVNV